MESPQITPSTNELLFSEFSELANKMYESGRNKEAVEAFRKAIEIQEEWYLYNRLGMALVNLQQYQEATSIHTFAPLQLGFQILHRSELKSLFLVAEHLLGAEPRRWAERREGEIRRCWTSGPYRRDPSRRWPSR